MEPQAPLNYPQEQKTSGLAIASLISSLLCIGLAGVICGHIALAQIKKSAGALKGRGLAIAGFVIGCLEIVVLFAGVVLVYSGLIDMSHRDSVIPVRADFYALDSALRMYKLNAGSYPTTEQGLNALKEKPTEPPVPVTWVKSMNQTPKDPWGTDYIYRFPGSSNQNEFEIISKGPDGREGTDDDLSSQKMDE